jgi:hypothetical protein
MSFTQTRFLGASITSFTSSVGWNEQESELTVLLVEDESDEPKGYWSDYSNSQIITYSTIQTTTAADSFNPPVVGSAVYFRYDNFEFAGILQSWQKKRDISGNPIYEVRLSDARSILEATELIINEYQDTIGTNVHNLLNVYGYHENLSGFGGARVNEAGMPWNKIREALIPITQNLALDYGKSLSFRGFEYRVSFDITFPAVPDTLRIGGTNTTLMDAIRYVCQESGYDFFVKTLYFGGVIYIHIKGASRLIQPLPGQIFAYANAAEASGIAVSISEGLELRKEFTSSFITGGNVEGIYETFRSPAANDAIDHNIWPYWGLDVNGNAILGLGLDDEHYVTVNSNKVNSAIVGQQYTFNVGEIRAALAGFEEWGAYLQARKPTFATALNLDKFVGWGLTPLAETMIGNGQAPPVVNLFKPVVKTAQSRPNLVGPNDDLLYEVRKLYSFVRSIGEEYYGKKFMVAIKDEDGNNVIKTKVDPDTLISSTNYTGSDGGWVEGSDNPPLDLPAIAQDIFKLEDHRYQAYVRYSFLDSNGDLSDIPLNDVFFQLGTATGPSNQTEVESEDYETLNTNAKVAWIKAQVDPEVVYLDKANFAHPRVVISLPGKVSTKGELDSNLEGLRILFEHSKSTTTNVFGDNVPVAATDKELKAISLIPFGGSDTAMINYATPAYIPHAAAVSLHSNVSLYGPWTRTGKRGKVYFEQDPSLVPWNYGGVTLMNTVGQNKADGVVTNTHESEYGSITFAGTPDRQLGDELTAGGPNITDINMSVGEGGVTTTYALKLYTPQFGRFSKQTNDRLTKLTKANQQLQRNLRGDNLKNIAGKAFQSFLSGKRANFGLSNKKSEVSLTTSKSNDTLKIVDSKTPHGVVVATAHRRKEAYLNPSNTDEYLYQYTGNVRYPTAAAMEFKEGVVNLEAHNPTGYQESALMSLEGLFRPFSLDRYTPFLPHFEAPTDSGIGSSFRLNPFATGDFGSLRVATDIQIMSCGSGDADPVFSTTDDNFNMNSARGLGHRFPMIGVGWGWNTDGNPCATGNGLYGFPGDIRTNMNHWKAGPVDFRWDDRTKSWVAGQRSTIGIVMMHSGFFPQPHGRPRYIVRNIQTLTLASGIQYQPTEDLALFGSGHSDKIVFNLQEGNGELHTVGSGSPVILLNINGIDFFDELPRSFARRTVY